MEKKTTIPRLELQAALYAARLKKTIEDERDFNLLWSESATVLSWKKNFKLKQDAHRKPNCRNKGSHKH